METRGQRQEERTGESTGYQTGRRAGAPETGGSEELRGSYTCHVSSVLPANCVFPLSLMAEEREGEGVSPSQGQEMLGITGEGAEGSKAGESCA